MTLTSNDLQAFRSRHRGMRLRPQTGSGIRFQGDFEFSAQWGSYPAVTDSYQLCIDIPEAFPNEIPKVWETGNKIPRDGNHHVNPDDTLCLGAKLRLKLLLAAKPTLSGFADTILLPYLYGMSIKLGDDGSFPFGELRHGALGGLDDYCELFSVTSHEAVFQALELLATKRRLANKRPCPCECGRRLGKCRLRLKLIELRKIVSRRSVKQHILELRKELAVAG